MNFRLLTFAFFAISLGGCSAPPPTLTEEEISALHEDIDKMMVSFQDGNVAPLLRRTHEAVYELAGGKDEYETAVRDSVQLLKDEKVTVTDSELKEPTVLHLAGDEEICFVPRVSTYDIDGKKIRSNSYMMCIRPATGGDWKYVDGSGFQNHPDSLFEMFPDLPRDIEPPVVWRQPIE